MFRFSLTRLLGFVAFVAVGIASLRNASYIISGLLFGTCIFFLMVAVLGAIYRDERTRAFWVGCCVFGWPFVAYGALPGSNASPFDRLIQSAYHAISRTIQIDRETAQAYAAAGENTVYYGAGGVITVRLPRQLPFRQAANALASFGIAVLGGAVGQWFYDTRHREGKKGGQ